MILLDEKRLKQETDNAIEWIKNYVEKSGAKGVVIGLSGGKDSATVLAMLARAIKKEKIIAVAMPCSSKKEDLEDAKLTAKTFGVKLITVDLQKAYNELENAITNENGNINYEAKINIKPRLRMTTLYAVAQNLGYLVAGTGNLSEAMVGYTTKWGDNSYDFNPIANFTVSEVLAIGQNLGVPEKILKRPPSDGLGDQTDEEKMGIKYSQIEEMIETGETEEKAKQEILKKFKNAEHKRKPIPVYTFERKNYLLGDT